MRCATSCATTRSRRWPTRRGAGDRRDRLSQAGQVVVRRCAPIHGSAGKITNCQIGVFAAYVSRHGHAFIDRALYLPKAWTDDPARLAAAHVPAEIGFATKPRLAVGMIRARDAAASAVRWVAADTVYGVGEIEQGCGGRARATCWASTHPPCPLLGQGAAGSRHGRGRSRTSCAVGLAAPVGQAPARKGRACTTGLSRAGRPRARRVRHAERHLGRAAC